MLSPDPLAGFRGRGLLRGRERRARYRRRGEIGKGREGKKGKAGKGRVE